MRDVSTSNLIYDATNFLSFIGGSPLGAILVLCISSVVIYKAAMDRGQRVVKYIGGIICIVSFIVSSKFIYQFSSALFAVAVGEIEIREYKVDILEINDARFRFKVDDDKYGISCDFGCVASYDGIEAPNKIRVYFKAGTNDIVKIYRP